MRKGHVVFYFLMSSISTLADSVFLSYVCLLVLQGKYGGILSSIVLGMDAFFEIVAGPFLARFVDTVADLKNRLKNSLILQLGLTVLTFSFALLNLHHPFAMISALAVIRFLILVDNQLKSALPICLDKQGIFSLPQCVSLNLFTQRCIIPMSSSIAVIFLSYSWFFSCSVNSLTYLSAILALTIIIKMIKTENLSTLSSNQEVSKKDTLCVSSKKKWIRWTGALVFTSGIAFGSTVLLLTKSMMMIEGQPLFMQIIQGPVPVYAGVLLALAIIMVFHKKVQPFIKNGKRVCLINFFLGSGLILCSFFPFYLRVILLFILGIINGVGHVGVESFFQRKVVGENFVKACAINQAWGKAGVLISLAGMGFCIDLEFDPLSLLAVSGTLAIFFCFILLFVVSKLEKSQEEVTGMTVEVR